MAAGRKKAPEGCYSLEQIKSHHKKLAEKLREHLRLEDYKAEAWVIIQKCKDGRAGYEATLKRPVSTFDQRGDEVAVLPLQPRAFKLEQEGRSEGCLLWASWWEKWHLVDRQGFELRSASWTFFKGYREDRWKNQFLRCEWDNPDRPNETHAQPHWHFEFEDDSLGVPILGTKGDLQELTEITGDGYAKMATKKGLAKRHFGMAAWDNRGSYPACWQRTLEPEILRKWAVKVLEHVQSELGLVSIC